MQKSPPQVAIDIVPGVGMTLTGMAHDSSDVIQALHSNNSKFRDTEDLSLADDDLSDDSDGLSLSTRQPRQSSPHTNYSSSPSSPTTTTPITRSNGIHSNDARMSQPLSLRLLSSQSLSTSSSSATSTSTSSSGISPFLASLWNNHSTKVIIGVACFFALAIILATIYGASGSNSTPADSISHSVRSLAEVYVRASANGVKLDDNGGAKIELSDQHSISPRSSPIDSTSSTSSTSSSSSLTSSSITPPTDTTPPDSGAKPSSLTSSSSSPSASATPVPLHALIEDHSPHVPAPGVTPVPVTADEVGSRQVAASARIEDTAAYPQSISSEEQERREKVRLSQQRETKRQIEALKVEAAVMQAQNDKLKASIVSLAHTIQNEDLRPALIYHGNIPGIGPSSSSSSSSSSSASSSIPSLNTFTSPGAEVLSSSAQLVRPSATRSDLRPALIRQDLPPDHVTPADEPDDVPVDPTHDIKTRVKPNQLLKDMLDAQNPNDLVDRVMRKQNQVTSPSQHNSIHPHHLSKTYPSSSAQEQSNQRGLHKSPPMRIPPNPTTVTRSNIVDGNHPASPDNHNVKVLPDIPPAFEAVTREEPHSPDPHLTA